jgi:hypothetical protein
VHAVIVAAGFAFSGAEKTSQRISRTDGQIFTKDILGQGLVPLKSYDSHHVAEQRSGCGLLIDSFNGKPQARRMSPPPAVRR